MIHLLSTLKQTEFRRCRFNLEIFLGMIFLRRVCVFSLITNTAESYLLKTKPVFSQINPSLSVCTYTNLTIAMLILSASKSPTATAG